MIFLSPPGLFLYGPGLMNMRSLVGFFIRFLWNRQAIDQTGHVPGTESIIDIDDGESRYTRIQHRQKGR